MATSAHALRSRVRRLLHDPHPAPRRRTLTQVLDRFSAVESTWEVFLFGGLPRDLAVAGPSYLPRDVDMVIAGATIDQIAHIVPGRDMRHNRFGGINFVIDNWSVDVWPIDRTWAFLKHWDKDISMANLPKTTFLNVEAIAVELRTTRGRARRVYEHHFFEGVRN